MLNALCPPSFISSVIITVGTGEICKVNQRLKIVSGLGDTACDPDTVLNKSVKRAKLKMENRKGDLFNGYIERRDKEIPPVHLWGPEVRLNLNMGQAYSHGSRPSKDVAHPPSTHHSLGFSLTL